MCSCVVMHRRRQVGTPQEKNHSSAVGCKTTVVGACQSARGRPIDRRPAEHTAARTTSTTTLRHEQREREARPRKKQREQDQEKCHLGRCKNITDTKVRICHQVTNHSYKRARREQQAQPPRAVQAYNVHHSTDTGPAQVIKQAF